MRCASTVRYAAQSLDARRYAETFAVFVSRSSEYTAIINRLEECASSQLPPNFSCLDIGAGTGSLLRDWKLHSPTTMPRGYVAVEPNDKHIPILRHTIQELCMEGEVIEESFDTIIRNSITSTVLPPNPSENDGNDKFDLVLFSHSLYWLQNPVQCIEQALRSWCKPDGVVLIFHQGPFCFYTLFHLFSPFLDRTDDGFNIPDHGLSSHELVNGLRGIGLNPARVDRDATHLDLTDLSERERDEILSFMLQVEFSELDEPLKNDIVQHLYAACVETNDGKLIFHHPNVTIHVQHTLNDGT